MICFEAPLSTMYTLSLECIAKPVAVLFRLCEDVTSGVRCVDVLGVSFRLEELLAKIV